MKKTTTVTLPRPLLALRGLVGAVRLIRDPNELGEVFEIADGLATPEILGSIRDQLVKDPACARAFVARHRLDVDLDDLSRRAPGSLGRVFADHMRANGLDPAALPKRPADDPLSFLQAHLYETHDVWHAVTGFSTDVAGELGLQAFYLAQFPSRLAVALITAGMINTLVWAWDDRDARMAAIARGYEMGKRAKPFFGVRWDLLWDAPIDEVRRSLRVDVAGEPVALAKAS